MERSSNTNKRKGGGLKEGESVLKVVGMEVFDCAVCSDPLCSPVYECSNGIFVRSRCCDELPESERVVAKPCSNVEHVINNIFVPCKHGCLKKIAYYEKEGHEGRCPFGPCVCPVPGCGLFAQSKELFAHLTTLHEFPSLHIRYFMRFEHPVKPGTQVLHGGSSGHLFLLDVAPVASESLDYGVSLSCVQRSASATTIRCSMCFSCLDGHYQVSKWDIVPSAAPIQRLCVVPKVSGGQNNVVLSITIDLICVDDEYDMLLEEENNGEDCDYDSEEEDD